MAKGNLKKSARKERRQSVQTAPPPPPRPWLGGELFWSAVFVIGLACVPTTFYGGSRTREAYVLRAEELFSDGAFSEAAAAYRRAVAVEETPDGHVFLAETLVRVKRLREAVAHYERAAALYDDPRERAAALASAARLHVERGSVERAVSAYARVLKLGANATKPDATRAADAADAHVLLAARLLAGGTRRHVKAAAAHLRRAVARAPGLAAAHALLADAYRDLARPGPAAKALEKVVARRPRDAAALAALGGARLELARFGEALGSYRAAAAMAPAAKDIGYALAALGGAGLAATTEFGYRAPVAYVERLFDLRARRRLLREEDDSWDSTSETIAQLAPNSTDEDDDRPLAKTDLFDHAHGLLFDDRLPKAHVKAIASALQVNLTESSPWLDVLELGCGSGALGPLLRGVANRLHCVDASAVSLEFAASTNTYDDLERGDFATNIRNASPGSVDLVVAVDAVPYVGDLGDLLHAMARALRPGGLAVFNADVLDDDVSMFASDSVRETFKLKFTGRWQHRVKYVKAQAKGKGLLLDAHAGVEKLRAESLLGWHAKSKEVVRLDAVSFVDTAVFAFRKQSA